MKRPGIAVLLALLFLCASTANADEFRMKDGERIFGALLSEKKGRYEIETGEGTRAVKVADVEARIEGPTPHRHLAAERAKLAKEDSAGRVTLMAYAWRHRLDTAARALAGEALDLDPTNEAAHALLGHVRLEGKWVDGWAAPFTAAGIVGPRHGIGRKRAASRSGATSGTESALQHGLTWLARHQDADGRIDADKFMKHDPEDDKCDGPGGGHHGEPVPCWFDGVVTALAVMAWVGDGSTHVSGPFQSNVERGAAFLQTQLIGAPTAFDSIWNWAFALMALSDLHASSRDPAFYTTIRHASAVLVRMQRQDGGWRYFPGRVGAVPTTSAVICALGMARQAGIPMQPRTAEQALAFLDARVDPGTGRSEYHAGAEKLGYTPTVRNAASALTARAFLGALAKAPHRGAQVNALLAKKPKWKIEFKKLKAPDGTMREFQIGTLDPYCWFYTTLALRQVAGSAWSRWFGSLKKALLTGQRKDGSAKGSWDPLGNYSNSGGRAFVTGMCCLMLEAPYRLPPPGRG